MTPTLLELESDGLHATPEGKSMKKTGCFATFIALATFLAAPAGAAPFISTFHRIHTVSSTVPRNGDVNPYGVAVVQQSVGRLRAGDILISNFNDSQNLQGT